MVRKQRKQAEKKALETLFACMFIVMQMIKLMIKLQTYGWQWAQPCCSCLYNAETTSSEEFNRNSFPLDEIQKENQDSQITHVNILFDVCWQTVPRGTVVQYNS